MYLLGFTFFRVVLHYLVLTNNLFFYYSYLAFLAYIYL